MCDLVQTAAPMWIVFADMIGKTYFINIGTTYYDYGHFKFSQDPGNGSWVILSPDFYFTHLGVKKPYGNGFGNSDCAAAEQTFLRSISLSWVI